MRSVFLAALLWCASIAQVLGQDFKDYYGTASSNTSLASLSLQEGQTQTKYLNNQIRQLMADLKNGAAIRVDAVTDVQAWDFTGATGKIPKTVIVDQVGLFYYDSADTTTADDGSTVLVTASSQRYKIFGSLAPVVPNSSAVTELTIASGAVTPSGFAHTIDTESDASSDNLDTITATNFVAGNLLMVSANNGSRTVVVKHGTGNILLPSDTDISLDDAEKTLLLRYDGSNWNYVAGANAGTSVSDTIPNAATATELTIATGAITPTRGTHTVDTESDAASDDLATITATNFSAGNILTLSAANTARTVVLKHGTGNILLPNDTDISLDDDEKTVFLRYDGTNWNYIAGAAGALPNTTPNVIATSELTIATGAITPTGFSHTVDTEGDAATDDLATITATNYKSGDIILLRAESASHEVVIKDGSGNIVLPNGIDLALNKTDRPALFQYDGTNWNWVAGGYAPSKAVNVMDFGAVGDNSADDQAAIQAAIDFVEAQTGANSTIYSAVYLPAGKYRVDSTITVSASGVRLFGDGIRATRIAPNFASGNVIYLDGSTGSGILGITIENMIIGDTAGTDRTSGANIYAQNVRDWRLHNLEIEQFYDGIVLDRSARIYADGLKFSARGRDVASNTVISVTSANGGAGNSTGNHIAHLEIQGGDVDVINGDGGAITASDQTFDISGSGGSDVFSASYVGKSITIAGAGTAGADLVTTIASYTSTTQVELTDAAATTVSNANWSAGYGHRTGVLIESSDGLYLDTPHIIGARDNLVVSPTGSGQKDFIDALFINSPYFDKAGRYNVLVEGTASTYGQIEIGGSGYIRAAGLDNFRFAASSAVDGVKIRVPYIRRAGRLGVNFATANADGILIDVPEFEDNNQLDQNSGGDIYVQGDEIILGDMRFKNGASSGAAVEIGSSSTNVRIGQLDLSDSTAGEGLAYPANPGSINLWDYNRDLYYHQTRGGFGKVQTTDSTVTTLWSYTIQPEELVYVEAVVAMRTSTNANGNVYKLSAAYQRDGALGPDPVLSPTQNVVAEMIAAANAVIDDSGNDIRIRVTGQAAATNNWRLIEAKVWSTKN